MCRQIRGLPNNLAHHQGAHGKSRIGPQYGLECRSAAGRGRPPETLRFLDQVWPGVESALAPGWDPDHETCIGNADMVVCQARHGHGFQWTER